MPSCLAMLPNLTVEISKEALVLPKTEANEADDSKEEIANEADDSVEIANVADDSKEEIVNVADVSVQAVADSLGGATRRCGSEAAEAVHQGARHSNTRQRKSQRK